MGAIPGIRRGYSMAREAKQAVEELRGQIAHERAGLVAFFCSSSYDLPTLAAELKNSFGDVPIIGCTTAGEIGPQGYTDGSIVGFSIAADECQAVSVLVSNMASFQMAEGQAAADLAISKLGNAGNSTDRSDTFALLLIDGLCANEEAVLASIFRQLDGIPLLGGSAGDDLRLVATHVYHDGAFHRDAALLTLVRTRRPFRIFRCQHFTGSDQKLVVTRADPAKRIVRELNAEPAALEYARACGLSADSLTAMMFAEYPVTVKVGGSHYVRSIRNVNSDGSLTFFCAIDEGVVLSLARPEDILHNLDRFFASVREEFGMPELVIGFDCILRNLEARNRQLRHLAGRLMAENNVIGFSTYGEQYAAMHVNQTFTAAVIGAVPEHDEE